MCLTKVGRTRLRLDVKPLSQHPRLFYPHPIAAVQRFPPRLKLNEEDVREAFVHGTGPGGQKINKTACAVQLKHLPTGLLTTCQETRSRSQNQKIAWRLLAEKVEAQEKGSESRIAIKAQVKSKKKASKTKKARRKHRGTEQDREEAAHEKDDGGDSGEANAIAELEEKDVKEERVG